MYKSGGTIAAMALECFAKGGNLLMNVGPTSAGTICRQERAALEQLAQWRSGPGVPRSLWTEVGLWAPAGGALPHPGAVKASEEGPKAPRQVTEEDTENLAPAVERPSIDTRKSWKRRMALTVSESVPAPAGRPKKLPPEIADLLTAALDSASAEHKSFSMGEAALERHVAKTGTDVGFSVHDRTARAFIREHGKRLRPDWSGATDTRRTAEQAAHPMSSW